ncbi:MAG: 2-C-methyl-D-erythritol 4-phosphate cytidylyltransferase [Candidatus Marinimicrobia bacterium]|jgi:2-C-methyl-D-erythritol 4-phosphate cytidylyltransferase|nr:2-C-methyl-D-erythritol 4-phosphate cytidylyltransferase [Candidatus Neomarinimicrobiota bacterium]MBT4064618.1 2-C-methyl-D-erythritol 4-phosphate cytidylyltransferase [Candidatus Neomarinimicrobiota bacterium]MBT4453584.1 2-C-methyl-D-erythritol 4-phosphate cytidylyltransferase [Candidatus Neomarinimicrobiota bacterium]MBT4735914.1 2-C-methyl-D-erythritol 4-phosphate cytidylyltransferase [Candidatus Neomarinimicrobiota bacterium]MBT5387127.1 2-C-methyl-D-erythritol 4-phosphate cytidylyltra
MKITVVIPAAGSGKRFGENKQLKILGDRPLVFHTLKPFIDSELINEIVVVAPKNDVQQLSRELKSMISVKSVMVVAGGNTRQKSVFNGLKAASDSSELICVHDAVRPFVTKELIEKAVNACSEHDGVIVAQSSTDTIKKVMDDQIMGTLPRETIWRAQTPQVFSKSALQEALKMAEDENIQGTDEASLLERIGYQVGFVEGSSLNIKITTEEDWVFAEAIFNHIQHD